IVAGKSFSEALESREFEPDSPNWTPRISLIQNFGGKYSYSMSILKSLDPEGSECSRYTFSYASKPGLGHFIHTYVTDGNPIPTFFGEPERIETMDCIECFTGAVWNSLNEENRISLWVRYTDIETGEYTERIINKHNR
ncbi:MAG: IMP cyclohydrolase, partial [Clostridia bacterium]|nr:IMP cyclohydrolase [Clostridia bacterium]